jgi:hypothetical protein
LTRENKIEKKRERERERERRERESMSDEERKTFLSQIVQNLKIIE